MKTQIIRFDKYELELVNLCDMTFQQCRALCSCVEASEKSKCTRVRDLVQELHGPVHWMGDWKNKTVSLVILSWQDVMVLAAVLSDEVDRLKTVPINHWFKEVSQFKVDHISKILEALNKTFAARIEDR